MEQQWFYLAVGVLGSVSVFLGIIAGGYLLRSIKMSTPPPVQRCEVCRLAAAGQPSDEPPGTITAEHVRRAAENLRKGGW